MIQTIGLLLGGFILLVLGAEVLVRGATRIAAMLGIPPPNYWSDDCGLWHQCP